ncbi:N-acetylglucosamine-6-phosphate deacetylase [Tropicimonas marinistellae]|uniref:N-acetylglucosamine-6-phosphate deacetylase n=1 Tax=Tropicimonas marinistellae TaxID=1739787 RepID=UPI00082D07A6|nr:N-acetylglucosamine-6-phosphate deacetylase [Tropicimonas marinistellae]
MAEGQSFAVLARTLYDGITDQPSRNILIRMAGGRIESVQPAVEVSRLPDNLLEVEIVTPGFIDLQINGANDVQFNHAPNVDGLKAIAEGARAGGTAHFLPTFTTAPGRAYRQAINAVHAAISEGVPGILGIHLEGPFFSRERPGIHPAEHIRALDDEDVRILCEAAEELPILLTLAPECQQRQQLRHLSAAGVVLFAGHSAATAEQMATARADGVVGATHLFNAMSQTMGRAPGIVGEVLGSRQGFAGIIADGIHVHPMNLAIAAHSLPDGLCLVTDAMRTLAGRQSEFDLYGKPIRLRDGKLTGPSGTLAGAHLAMDEAVRNLHELAHLPFGRCVRMATANPACCLKLRDELGQVAQGSRASLSLLNGDRNAVGVVIDGTPILQ